MDHFYVNRAQFKRMVPHQQQTSTDPHIPDKKKEKKRKENKLKENSPLLKQVCNASQPSS
jgi:hypothetical protein